MTTSLSVLLPAHNVEHRLEREVVELLDLLPELSRKFELLIIDDGSTDETAEIARDLAMRFPQVDVIRHPVRLGIAEAVQTGLDNTSGEVVFVSDEHCEVNPADLLRLWELRDDPRLVVARHEPHAKLRPSWKQRLLPWRTSAQPAVAAAPRVQMIRRAAWEKIAAAEVLGGSGTVRRMDLGMLPAGPASQALLAQARQFVAGR